MLCIGGAGGDVGVCQRLLKARNSSDVDNIYFYLKDGVTFILMYHLPFFYTFGQNESSIKMITHSIFPQNQALTCKASLLHSELISAHRNYFLLFFSKPNLVCICFASHYRNNH